jgi:hypothetical protein
MFAAGIVVRLSTFHRYIKVTGAAAIAGSDIRNRLSPIRPLL